MGILSSLCNKPNPKKTRTKKDPEDQQHIFGFTKDGLKKDADQAGQDNYDIISSDLGQNIYYFAVYDGHGIKGREASAFAKDEIHKYLIKEKIFIATLQERKEAEKFFNKIFTNVQNKFKKKNTDFETSGTCAICILIVNNHCFIVNLGDSRAIIGHNQLGNKIVYQMSIDHKANRSDEKERIEKSGGYVAMEHEKGLGPFRVYSKNDDGPGLAVSRSLGDVFGHTVGVSHFPEISYKLLEENDVFIVIGSDGIWDVMNSPEVVGYVFEKIEKEITWSRQRIVEELVQECRNRWELINIYKEKIIIEKMTAKEKEKENNSQNDNENMELNNNTVKTNRPMVRQNIDDITGVICFFGVGTE